MAKPVFYSFYYDQDSSRVAQVRNIGMVDANPPARDNDWEEVTKGRDPAIRRWIEDQLSGRSCTVVMIGAQTAGRKWINYEIVRSWDEGKGVFGVHIHHLKNLLGLQSYKGRNPFAGLRADRGMLDLTNVVRVYDPPYTDSKQTYSYIAANLSGWIDQAVESRQLLKFLQRG